MGVGALWVWVLWKDVAERMRRKQNSQRFYIKVQVVARHRYAENSTAADALSGNGSHHHYVH